MPKGKSADSYHYELLYIIANKFTEDEAQTINEKVKGVITANEGNILAAENWGKKRLAYAINLFNYGYYNLIDFDIAGEELAKISRELKISREILRFQIIKKKFKTAAQIQQDKKIAEKIIAKTAKKEKEAEEKTKIKAKDKEKLELKDLDKKLDKILDTDDLL